MRHLHRRAELLLAQGLHLAAWIQTARGRDTDKDRGSDVVATIILTAGLAAVAFAIYLAVKGKVGAWIAKIPGQETAP